MFKHGAFFTDLVVGFVFVMGVGMLIVAPLPPRRVVDASGSVGSEAVHPSQMVAREETEEQFGQPSTGAWRAAPADGRSAPAGRVVRHPD